MAKNNLAKLAKGSAVKKSVPIKKAEPKVSAKPKTPEEERDLKAKQRVAELLEGVELIPKSQETIEAPKITEGLEWLEDQVAALSIECEKLRTELAEAKENYAKIYNEYKNKSENNNSQINDAFVKNTIILFNELQNNLLGNNPERTVWTVVNISHVLNQMIRLFPFTANYKRF